MLYTFQSILAAERAVESARRAAKALSSDLCEDLGAAMHLLGILRFAALCLEDHGLSRAQKAQVIEDLPRELFAALASDRPIAPTKGADEIEPLHQWGI